MPWFGFGRNRPSDGVQTIPADLRRLLVQWMMPKPLPKMRSFLETHLSLLQPDSERFFSLAMADAQNKPEVARKFQQMRDVLSTAREHGATAAAARDAFVDVFGALRAFELPSWLATRWEQIAHSLNGSAPASVGAALREVIDRCARDTTIPAEITASLRSVLAEYLVQGANEPSEEAFDQLNSALSVFTTMRFPRQHANVQRLFGTAYFLIGLRSHNERMMRQAIPHFESAMPFFPRESEPEIWASIQMGLGIANSANGNLQRAEAYLTNARQVLTPAHNRGLSQLIDGELERIAMVRLEQEQMLGAFGQILDEDMIAGIKSMLERTNEDE